MRRKRVRNFDILTQFENYTPGWGGVGILLLLILAGNLVGSVLALVLVPFLDMTYIMAVTYPVIFLPAMFFCSGKSARSMMFEEDSIHPIDHSRIHGGRAVLVATAAAIATVACAITIEPIQKLMPPMPDYLQQTLGAIVDAPLWLSLLTTAVMAPFFEEWLCRGMVLRGLLTKTNPTIAIITSAAFFALIHANLWQAVPAFILGCLLGLAYYKTGSLKITMLMHCANNAFSVILTSMPATKDCDYISDIITNQYIYLAVLSACVAIAIAFITMLYKKELYK